MEWFQRLDSVDSPFRTCSTMIAFSSVYGLEVNPLVHPPTGVKVPTLEVQSAVGGIVGVEGEEEEWYWMLGV